MAEESAQDKTEEPTSKREEEFREEGNVARSADITTLMIMIVGVISLGIIGPKMTQTVLASFEGILNNRNDSIMNLTIAWVNAFVYPTFKYLLIFFLTITATSVLSTMAQTGIMFTPKALMPKFDSINPASGLKKVFSSKTVVQLIKNILKVFLIGWIVYDLLKDHMNEFMMLSTLTYTDVTRWTVSLIGQIVVRVSLLLGSISIFDYFYQWYTIHQKKMMSRQEIKDEMKDSELPSHIKSKVRQIAQERAKKVIKKEVPTADVIITNPTHYAVAIRYTRFKDKAPRVVAKGQDYLAAAIKKIAEEHKIPLYEYPELARSLYRTCKVGKYVPSELYEALARVLAFIFKMNKQRKKVHA